MGRRSSSSMSRGARRWPPLLLPLVTVLLLSVVAGTLAQYCAAGEMTSASECHVEVGGADSKLQQEEGAVTLEAAVEEVVPVAEEEEEEELFEYEDVESDEEGEDDDDDDDDEEDDDDEDEDDEEEEGDESDFQGEDFEDEFEGEEGAQPDEPEEQTLDETDVVVLGGDNFSEFVKSNHYVLVEFYAPWCGHCRALAPEYAEAATLLKGKAALAKVDATAHDLLAREYSVESYPALFFFIDGVHKKYTGHNKRDEIVNWVTKKTSLTVDNLLSKADAELVLDSQKSTMAIALLNSVEGAEVEELTSAARQEDDVQFYITNSAEVAQLFSIPNDVKRPALVLLKQEPEKVSLFDGTFKRDAISEFVTKHKLPLIVTFNKETSALIFESPIRKQVILFANPDDFKRLKPEFTEASKALLGKLVFVYVDLEDSDQAPSIIEFFGLKGDKPAVMGYETEENGRKFLLEGAITAQSVKAFGEGFLSDSLRPHLKSDPVPETNDEDVKTVVGLNLDDIVLDESKDAFLEIYAPWCGHCQALEPIWNKLARRLRAVESIVITKMDGTTNEHDRAKSDGFPTLLFFPAGKKSFDPITFDGDRTVKEFIKFLKKEAAIPFTVPKKPDSQGNSPVTNASTSTTSSEEPSSEPGSTAGAEEPSLESVIQDSWSAMKDEL